MAAPDRHADRRELRYLREYGVEVETSLDTLRLKVPRPSRMARAGMLLVMGWGVLVPFSLLNQALPVLYGLVAIVATALLALSAVYALVFISMIVLVALTPVQRSIYTELLLTPQALQSGQHRWALESLGHLSVQRRLGRWRLQSEVGGQSVVLAEMSSQTPLDRLRVLIRRHVAHRRSELEAQGHDLAESGAVPAALEALLSGAREG